MLTDTSTDRFAAHFGDDMAGKNGGSAAAAAKLVALCVIVGWPAFMAWGFLSARKQRRSDQC